MKKINAADRLILPLDVSSIEEAQDYIEKLDGVISFFKIGIELQMLTAPDFIRELIDSKKQVFLDYKYLDIPETVKRAVSRVSEMGISFLTVHGHAKNIRAALEGRGDSDLKIMSVTILTSLDGQDIKELFGYPGTVEDLVLQRAKSAMEAGCDGVIASGHEARAIKEMAQSKLLVVTPGIRHDGDPGDDQKRRMSPEQAIKEGADYLVIGRPIRNAPDPRAKAIEIIEEMDAAFQLRESG
ncbi:MAG TPA: orotidine-5'-phosphate decarboxylase [Anaerolineales bacterium]|nr:orotidine-5'-phosphate decarboxylase [Anaerolineales bacterium]